jgi:HK97 family phage prohead protease
MPLSPLQFANAVRRKDAPSRATVAAARDGYADYSPSNDGGRIVRYTLSTPDVARDGHTIAASAWRTQNYMRNPVFLWAHDMTVPPIGRMVEIGTFGSALRGNVEYADEETNPFGAMIFRMVTAGLISAVSVSWEPLTWKWTTDKSRPQGIDFTDVDLLEVSQVPVPALPSALADGRAAGIDLRPLRDWSERALDTNLVCGIPRWTIEALYRSSSAPTRTLSGQPKRRFRYLLDNLPEDTRMQRIAKARALKAAARAEDTDEAGRKNRIAEAQRIRRASP